MRIKVDINALQGLADPDLLRQMWSMMSFEKRWDGAVRENPARRIKGVHGVILDEFPEEPFRRMRMIFRDMFKEFFKCMICRCKQSDFAVFSCRIE